MTQFNQKMVQFNLRRRIERGVLLLRRCISCFWEKLLICSLGKPIRYRMLPRSSVASPSPSVVEKASSTSSGNAMPPVCHHNHNHHHHLDADNLVALKISLLGDCHIGKTSFVVKINCFPPLILISLLDSYFLMY